MIVGAITTREPSTSKRNKSKAITSCLNSSFSLKLYRSQHHFFLRKIHYKDHTLKSSSRRSTLELFENEDSLSFVCHSRFPAGKRKRLCHYAI
mmetsp:Transcript_23403/g.57568  ORF Transcript_23403/g.57568 Transcript_23403/m.57568 type:complete len:93 (-) Transcript_23403:1258-1536(-)